MLAVIFSTTERRSERRAVHCATSFFWRWIVGFGVNLPLTVALSQSFPIQLSGNGTLQWSNDPAHFKSYQVQWAPSVSGPWSMNWSAFQNIANQQTNEIIISVPMFYRVTGTPYWDYSTPSTKLTTDWGISCAAVYNSIFVIGENVGDLAEYSVASNAWSARPSMPAPTWGFALETSGDDLFVISGYNTAAVRKYNILSNQWFTLASIPTTQRFTASVLLNGSIYVLGGTAGGLGTLPNSEITQYSIMANSWTVAAHLNHPRQDGAACALNNHIYYVGGVYDTAGTAALKVERFDPATGTCVELAAMSKMRESPQLFTAQGKIYAFGGNSSTNGIVMSYWADGECYDPEANTWSPIPAAGTNTILMFASPLKEKVFLIGDRHVRIFDPTTGLSDWAPLPVEPLVSGSLSLKFLTALHDRLFVPTFSGSAFHFAVY